MRQPRRCRIATDRQSRKQHIDSNKRTEKIDCMDKIQSQNKRENLSSVFAITSRIKCVGINLRSRLVVLNGGLWFRGRLCQPTRGIYHPCWLSRSDFSLIWTGSTRFHSLFHTGQHATRSFAAAKGFSRADRAVRLAGHDSTATAAFER